MRLFINKTPIIVNSLGKPQNVLSRKMMIPIFMGAGKPLKLSKKPFSKSVFEKGGRNIEKRLVFCVLNNILAIFEPVVEYSCVKVFSTVSLGVFRKLIMKFSALLAQCSKKRYNDFRMTAKIFAIVVGRHIGRYIYPGDVLSSLLSADIASVRRMMIIGILHPVEDHKTQSGKSF